MKIDNINLKFSSWYKEYQEKKLHENPYYEKIYKYTISELVHLQDIIKEKLDKTKDKILQDALVLCEKRKVELKTQTYKKYSKETCMEIDKKFEKHLEENSNKELSPILDVLKESSPPSGSAKKFSEDPKVKKGFKDRYGKDWKGKMYATAWKMFKKNKTVKEETQIDEAPTLDKKSLKARGGVVLTSKKYKGKPKGLDKTRMSKFYAKDKKFSGKTPEKKYQGLDISQRRKKASAEKKAGITTKASKERHKAKHFKGSNELAAVRFWNYRKANPKYRGNPQQTGMNKNVKDGDIKGRFVRYYGAKGQKSRNKKPAAAIRMAISNLIAQGKWPTPNARKALAKGREARWKNRTSSIKKD